MCLTAGLYSTYVQGLYIKHTCMGFMYNTVPVYVSFHVLCVQLCHFLWSPTYIYIDDYSDSSVYQEYDNPTYHDYRAEAQLQAQLRHEAFQKAAAAWRSNRKDLASYYAAQVCYRCPASFDMVRHY